MSDAKPRKANAKPAGKKNTKRTRAARRPAGPARQMAPTPERYREVQEALARHGYYSGPTDGNWTGECVESLKRFQSDRNLGADGKLGALSLIALGLGPNQETAAETTSRSASPAVAEP